MNPGDGLCVYTAGYLFRRIRASNENFLVFSGS
jgi:hypothetical protein